MAATKKAKKVSDRKMTESSEEGVRRREKALGTPKEKQQSNTRVRRRLQGERGARRRVGAVDKQIVKLNKKLEKKQIAPSKHKRSLGSLLGKRARAARMSVTASGWGQQG